MDIQAEKLELIEMLLQTESKTILEKVRTVFIAEKKENETQLSEEQWAIVEERKAEYLRGESTYHTWEEAKEIILRK